jgi:hypothetical protein
MKSALELKPESAVPVPELKPSALVEPPVAWELPPERVWLLAVSQSAQPLGPAAVPRLWAVSSEEQRPELEPSASERPMVAVAGPGHRQGADQDTP